MSDSMVISTVDDITLVTLAGFPDSRALRKFSTPSLSTISTST